MALKIKNKTNQVIPVIYGEEEIRILPRATVVVAIQKPTNQILALVKKNKLEIRK